MILTVVLLLLLSNHDFRIIKEIKYSAILEKSGVAVSFIKNRILKNNEEADDYYNLD